MHAPRAVLVLLVTAVAAATSSGCATGSDAGAGAGAAAAASSRLPTAPSGSAATSSAGSAASSAAGPTSGEEPTGSSPFPADSQPDTAQPGDGADLTVTALRVAAQDGFDRVVLELAGDGAPGWDVRYVDEATDPGTGEPVEVEGAARLQVQLTGIGSPHSTDRAEYSGPRTLTAPGTSAVEAVVWKATYEGVSLAFVGTSEQLPFRVQALSSPTRVVIDVAHR